MLITLLNALPIQGAVAILILMVLPASAQQTIFNVPSAEGAGHGQWFYQHQSTARAWDPGRRWVQTNAFGFGVGHSLELDTTWFNLDPTDVAASAASVGFKWSPRLNAEDSLVPLRLAVGDLVEFHGPTPHVGNWAYLMLNAELLRDRTFLAGGLSTGTQVLFGERRTTAAMASIEHWLTKRWLVQADWISGTHDLAYVIPGVVYRASPHWMVSLGYQIPNRHSHGATAIVFELTRVP
ncbi:MAG: hypothetical protein NTV70_24415 [Acidobacteria bacterium]|nr:hypothetical protein [Acidobacteriota bacterium]